MPKERDQTNLLPEDAHATRPCNGCARRSICLVRFTHDLITEIELPDVKQIHLLSSCSGFTPAIDASDIVHDMRPSLTKAGVTHLCDGCTETDTCGPNHALKELQELAAKNGLLVAFTTVCCATRTRPRKRLLQIVEQKSSEHS